MQITSANADQFLPQPGSGTLTTLQPQIAPSLDDCRLPDPNGFAGRQNRLYRLEIHKGGDPAGGTTGSLQVGLGQNAAAGATTLQLAQTLTPSQTTW